MRLELDRRHLLQLLCVGHWSRWKGHGGIGSGGGGRGGAGGKHRWSLQVGNTGGD